MALRLEELKRMAKSVYIAPADIGLPPLRLPWSAEAFGGREEFVRGHGYAYKILLYPNVRWVEVVVDVWSKGERALLYARFTDDGMRRTEEVEEVLKIIVETALRRGHGTLVEKLREVRSMVIGRSVPMGHGG